MGDISNHPVVMDDHNLVAMATWVSPMTSETPTLQYWPWLMTLEGTLMHIYIYSYTRNYCKRSNIMVELHYDIYIYTHNVNTEIHYNMCMYIYMGKC